MHYSIFNLVFVSFHICFSVVDYMKNKIDAVNAVLILQQIMAGRTDAKAQPRDEE